MTDHPPPSNIKSLTNIPTLFNNNDFYLFFCVDSPDSSSLIPDISDDMVVTTIISVLELHEECRHDENEDFDDATIQSADEDVDGNDDNVDDNSDENIVAVDSKDSIKKGTLAYI